VSRVVRLMDVTSRQENPYRHSFTPHAPKAGLS
jgi:hypothetical protein